MVGRFLLESDLYARASNVRRPVLKCGIQILVWDGAGDEDSVGPIGA